MKKVINVKYGYGATSSLNEEFSRCVCELLKEYAMLDKDLTVVQDIENASGCFMGFRTDLFKEVGGFDKRYFMYFEDADISREAAKRKRVVYFPEAVVYHLWGRDSKRNLKLLRIHIFSMLKYFIKWKSI